MEQRRFTSEMEWAPFKCLFWNVNDSVLKVMVSVTSGVLQAFLLNYVKVIWQRQQMPKTYDNIKVDFL